MKTTSLRSSLTLAFITGLAGVLAIGVFTPAVTLTPASLAAGIGFIAIAALGALPWAARAPLRSRVPIGTTTRRVTPPPQTAAAPRFTHLRTRSQTRAKLPQAA